MFINVQLMKINVKKMREAPKHIRSARMFKKCAKRKMTYYLFCNYRILVMVDLTSRYALVIFFEH